MRLLQLKFSCQIFHWPWERPASTQAATENASRSGAGSWVRMKSAPFRAAMSSAASVAAPASPGARPVTARRKDLRDTDMKTGRPNRSFSSPSRARIEKDVSGRGPTKKTHAWIENDARPGDAGLLQRRQPGFEETSDMV